MRHADSKSNARQPEFLSPESLPPEFVSPESGSRAVPTFVATALLEKLIDDRDAAAVDRRIIQRLRH